jgi:hypothetical protein
MEWDKDVLVKLVRYGRHCKCYTNLKRIFSKISNSFPWGTVESRNKKSKLDKKKKVVLLHGVANNQYFKSTAGYNTGILKMVSVVLRLSHWQGDGYNDGTECG